MKNLGKQEGLRQAIKAFSFLSGVGIYLAVVVGLCVFAGSKVDEFFGISPCGKLAGILLGFPVAIYSLYRQMKKNDLV